MNLIASFLGAIKSDPVTPLAIGLALLVAIVVVLAIWADDAAERYLNGEGDLEE